MANTDLEEMLHTLTQMFSMQTQQLSEQNQYIIKLADVLDNFLSYMTDTQPLKEVIGKKKISYHIPKGFSLFQRGDGRWEARMMVDGKQKFIANGKDKDAVYQELQQAICNKFKRAIRDKKESYTVSKKSE